MITATSSVGKLDDLPPPAGLFTTPFPTFSDALRPIPLLVHHNKLPFLCRPLFQHRSLTAYYEVCFEFMGPQGRQKLARWGSERAKYKSDRDRVGCEGLLLRVELVEGGRVAGHQARYFCRTVET